MRKHDPMPPSLMRTAGAFMALRIIAVLAIWYWLPSPLRFWTDYQEYKETEFFRLAAGLVTGDPAASFRTIGFPLALAPFVWATRAAAVDRIADLVILFQGCVLGSVTIALLARIAWLCAKTPRVVMATLLLWALAPLSALRLAPPFGVEWLRAGYLLFIEVSPEAWYVGWALTAVWALCESFEDTRLRWPVLAGGALGLMVLTEPQSLALTPLLLVFLIGRRPAAFVWSAAVFLSVISLQLGYLVWSEGGGWPRTLMARQQEEWLQSAPIADVHSMWSLRYSVVNVVHLWRALPVLERLALVAGGIASALGLRRLAQRQPQLGYVFLGWTLPLIVVMSGYWGFTLNTPRYLLPILPAICLGLAAYAFARH